MKHDLIVLMGGQGVGKGTFSKMLRARHEYSYVEIGALLRELPAESEIAKTMARGELVSDDLIYDLLQNNINCATDVILDGFPRNISQAKWLVEKFADKFNVHVLYLSVPEEIMIARINKRINEGGGRADDADASVIRRRLDTFWKTTFPAIEWLKTAPNIKFSEIDVRGDVNDNFANILAALEN